MIALLEEEDDINQITEYFSYEHFYVIYCKFWEIDTDHDLLISKEDLARHQDQGKFTKIGAFLCELHVDTKKLTLDQEFLLGMRL